MELTRKTIWKHTYNLIIENSKIFSQIKTLPQANSPNSCSFHRRSLHDEAFWKIIYPSYLNWKYDLHILAELFLSCLFEQQNLVGGLSMKADFFTLRDGKDHSPGQSIDFLNGDLVNLVVHVQASDVDSVPQYHIDEFINPQQKLSNFYFFSYKMLQTWWWKYVSFLAT